LSRACLITRRLYNFGDQDRGEPKRRGTRKRLPTDQIPRYEGE